MFYYSYILFCHKKQKLYYGYTKDLKRRIYEHMHNNRPYSFTRNEKIELIYFEAYRNEEDALNRERNFKSGWGRNYINKVLHNYLKNMK